MSILLWTRLHRSYLYQVSVQWFNQTSKTNFNPGQKEILFGVCTVLNKQDNMRKLFNYTLLFMRYFIYKCKLKEDALLLSDFIYKLRLKHSVETE